MAFSTTGAQRDFGLGRLALFSLVGGVNGLIGSEAFGGMFITWGSCLAFASLLGCGHDGLVVSSQDSRLGFA